MLIHPSQIEPSHKIYTPNTERVEWARAVVDLFEKEGIAKGLGSVSYKNKMVDVAVYAGAKKTLDTMNEIETKQKGRK